MTVRLVSAIFGFAATGVILFQFFNKKQKGSPIVWRGGAPMSLPSQIFFTTTFLAFALGALFQGVFYLLVFGSVILACVSFFCDKRRYTKSRE